MRLFKSEKYQIMNKSTLSVIAFLVLTLPTFAQDWKTDFDSAKKEAHDANKKLIMVFQGSDWCAPCMKLNQEIWSSEAFKNYAKEHYVLLKVDFPRKKANALPAEQQEKNGQLAETYNKNGYFPFVVVLDPQGKVVGETGYKHISPEEYISQLNSL